MIKLAKQNLCDIIRLIAFYRPTLDNIDFDIAKLYRAKTNNYMFVVRREKSWLLDFENIYIPASYENLVFKYVTERNFVPFDLFYLYVTAVKNSHVIGNLLVLDNQLITKDVAMFELKNERARKKHYKDIVKAFSRHGRYSTIMDFIGYLKGSEVYFSGRRK